MPESRWTIDTLKEFIFKVVDDNDKRYAERFTSQETAVKKAEDAQREYNVKSNEFRQALDDANKINMARTEVLGLIKNLADRNEAANNSLEKTIDGIKADIIVLREFKSSTRGKEFVQIQDKDQKNFNIGITVAVVTSFLSLVISIVSFFVK